jgi:hypothetical protein
VREYSNSFGNWAIIATILFAAGLLVWALLARTSLELRPSFITSQRGRLLQRPWRYLNGARRCDSRDTR